MSAAEPMAGPSGFVADLVVIDPSEVPEIAEFDLLDIGEGCPLFPSVSRPFHGPSVLKAYPLPAPCAKSSTLQRYLRHFISVPPGFWVIMKAANAPSFDRAAIFIDPKSGKDMGFAW
jgi:hypothetical protein